MNWRNRIVGYRVVKAAELLAHPERWRVHSDGQRQALVSTLEAVGWVDAVLYNRNTQRLIDGHLRRDLNPDADIPVLDVELTEDEERIILATLDPLTDRATADKDALTELLNGIETNHAGILDFLSKIAEQHGVECGDVSALDDPGSQIDRAAEWLAAWGVEYGQVWEIPGQTLDGCHRLMCGDSTSETDMATLIGDADPAIAFTSPPYNVGTSSHLNSQPESAESKYIHSDDALTGDDYLDLLTGFTRLALRHCDYAIVNIQSVAGNKRALIDYLSHFRDHFADVAVWHKTNAAPAMGAQVMTSQFEFVYFFGRADQPSRAIRTASFARGSVSNVYMGAGNAHNEFADVHAATFPLHLPTWVIQNFSQRGDGVVDQFCGTGTTMVACEQLGRRGYGMELSPSYVAVILQRLHKMGLTPRLVSI